MPTDLTKDQLDAFKIAVEQYQENGTGTIATKDVAAFLVTLGYDVPDEVLTNALHEIDPDNSGLIEMHTFLSMAIAKFQSYARVEQIQKLFDILDTNKDGYLTPQEMRRVAEITGFDISDEKINEMVQILDVDGDGKVSFEEFSTLFKRM
ncbi:neo-calmodulin-like [Teleopsis dalmanni]|uniref:neo-calmodulin-like n=1 Tax=Teleopsis dalmanni TaxID=139649 RepID=UPI0018CDBE96|nr:neo-calmodulin-like [Teleopsis dalmanni]XP_037960727.1 neo-calmodulin-like [Teleopsis dalmanni]